MKVRYVKGAYEHDITDVLYPTKEQLMAGGVCFASFTEGKLYDVISIELGEYYRIVDNSGDDYLYPKEAFEIVEALPKPPILTKEEWERGESDKYMVVKHEIDEDNLVFPDEMTIVDWYEGRCEAYDKPKEYAKYPDMDIEDAIEAAYAKTGKRELAIA